MHNENNERSEILKYLVDTVNQDAKFIRNVESNYVLPLMEVIQENGPTRKYLSSDALRRAFNSFPVLTDAWDRLSRDLLATRTSHGGKETKPYLSISRFLSGHALEPAYKNLAGYYDTFRTKLKYLMENPDYFMLDVLTPNQPLTLYKPGKVLRTRPIVKRHEGVSNDAFEDSTEETVEKSYVFLEKPIFTRIERSKDLESEYYVNNKMWALKSNAIRRVKDAHRYPLKSLENLRSNLRSLLDRTPSNHPDAKTLAQIVEKCDSVVNSFSVVYNLAKSKIPPLKPLHDDRIKNFMGVL